MFFDAIDDAVFKQEPKKDTDEGTPAQKPSPTGSKYLGEGAVCERADDHANNSCFLEKSTRDRVISHINSNIPMVMTNYVVALEHARIQTLLHKKAGWGPVGELMFNALSAALLAGVGWAVAQIAKRGVQAVLDAEFNAIKATVKAGSSVAQAEKAVTDSYLAANAGAATSVVKQVTSILKPDIKSKFDQFPADVAMKGAFISQLQAQASPMFAGIRDTVEEQGDDAALVAIMAAYDPAKLTIPLFEQQIAALLGRFDSNHIAEIGPRKQGSVTAGTTETVLIAAHGRSRLAVVEFGAHKKLGQSRGETSYTDGNDYFLNFVDDDLMDAAASAQRSANGAIKVIDVHAGHRFHRASELDQWIAHARLGSMLRSRKGP